MPASHKPHICLSSNCGCGMSRRDFMRLSTLATAGAALPLLFSGDAHARRNRGEDQPVRIGYLPITDAAPLLVAHDQQLFEAEGLTTERPRLFRSWAQLVEAFVAGQVNVIHLLSPATLWVRYGTRFPAKVVAWNHVNGSALTVAHHINEVKDLGGQTVAVPFWYSIHNILLQKLLVEEGLTPITQGRGAPAAHEVRLIVQPPAEMVSALASGSIAGFIVAEPFNALAEARGVGKVLRFSGDIWKDHACCVTFLAERDIEERPEWAQRVTHALVKAQAWSLQQPTEMAQLLSNGGRHRYTPHDLEGITPVFSQADFQRYQQQGVIKNRDWAQQRMSFQPFPYPSYTENLVRSLQATRLEGESAFLQQLDPAFVAQDLVDDRFVRRAIEAVGGPEVFGIAPGFERQEVIRL